MKIKHRRKSPILKIKLQSHNCQKHCSEEVGEMQTKYMYTGITAWTKNCQSWKYTLLCKGFQFSMLSCSWLCTLSVFTRIWHASIICKQLFPRTFVTDLFTGWKQYQEKKKGGNYKDSKKQKKSRWTDAEECLINPCWFFILTFICTWPCGEWRGGEASKMLSIIFSCFKLLYGFVLCVLTDIYI